MAAPMLCAGLTTWSPLIRANTGPGKKVAVVGMYVDPSVQGICIAEADRVNLSGGLGHFAILWANALGAEVYAISHSPDKEEDAKKLGAKEFIDSTKKDWAKPWAFTFDFILNSADMTNTFNMSEYMSTLNIGGVFHNVGLPDQPLPQIKAQDFSPNGAAISGSHIGNRVEALSMLKLASEKNIKPMIETIDVSEKGCKEAVERVNKNDVRYRFTLVNFDKAFESR